MTEKRSLIAEYLMVNDAERSQHGSFEAAALFLDISGFTRMTSVLGAHGKAGAETLSEIINRVFHPVVNHVYRGNGFVSTFSGDAFTALFPGLSVEAVLQRAIGIADSGAQGVGAASQCR